MTHRYTPRLYSGCCIALVANQRCSECNKPAPWRTRLTADEAERVTARLTRPVVVLTPEQRKAGAAALWGDNYD